ncbi:MAG: penicillin-binding transpeptidase domain-containing protein [Dysgonamonadaceae bacterium]
MSDDNKHIYESRKTVISLIAIAVVIIYTLRLFYLQIYQDQYKDSADSNAFFKKVLYPARGNISDRNSKLLVFNEPTYNIVFIPREVKNFDTLDFCKIMNITVEDFNKRMEDIRNTRLNPGYSSYTLQTFMTQLNAEEYGLFQERMYKFPGFSIQNRTMREYTHPNAGNVLGYVAEVSRERLEDDDYYTRGDYEGKSGIEKTYEETLRGVKGVEILLRDAHGRIQGKYNNGQNDRAPVSGKNLTLSIDMDLQAYGEYLMQNKLGSIVMIEPETGEILCMVTAPSYNPALMTGRGFGANYKTLVTDPLKPLFNRPILGVYPPGSTFKTTQGLIFQQEGIITAATQFPCHHGYPPLGNKPACHGHPSPLSLTPAIATSCNSYFCYGLNGMLSNRTKYKNINEALEVWKQYLVNMGLGYKLGVDLPSEKRGFIPNSKFYSKAFRTQKWAPSYVISVAIGQGEITTTPLQIANIAAGIANRGYFITPHIVKKIQGMPLDTLYTKKHYSGIEPRYYEPIVDGMAKSVTGGTSTLFNLLPDFETCGKTGTAQNPHGQDHSIFMGFAPRNHPKVAIAVIVENGGWGASYAVPIARLMVEKYLKGVIPERDKHLEEHMAKTVILPGIRSTRKSSSLKLKVDNQELQPATPTATTGNTETPPNGGE